MKTTLLTILIMLSAMFMVGCESNTSEILIVDVIPAAPQGVFSVTGDDAVYIYWNGPYEEDIAAYTVYRSFNETTGFLLIGVVSASSNPNLDLITYEYIDNTAVNGQTYYYAVSAVDDADQESELSAENVFDTPRPEGTVTLVDRFVAPNNSGLILDSILFIVADDNPLADVYVDSDINNILYLNTTFQGVDIQDMGYTDSFDDISYAPVDGWSNNGYVELIVGHTYVVWDDDLFFAKLRVESIVGSSVNFRWAFQLDNDNPELVQPKYDSEKPILMNSKAKRIASLNQ